MRRRILMNATKIHVAEFIESTPVWKEELHHSHERTLEEAVLAALAKHGLNNAHSHDVGVVQGIRAVSPRKDGRIRVDLVIEPIDEEVAWDAPHWGLHSVHAWIYQAGEKRYFISTPKTQGRQARFHLDRFCHKIRALVDQLEDDEGTRGRARDIEAEEHEIETE